jgi:hypothetical protein
MLQLWKNTKREYFIRIPKIVDRLSSTNKIIVINGLLHLFLSDPHIDKIDAKNLIKEISSSLRKLSEDRLVIVSFVHCNVEYNHALLPVLISVSR